MANSDGRGIPTPILVAAVVVLLIITIWLIAKALIGFARTEAGRAIRMAKHKAAAARQFAIENARRFAVDGGHWIANHAPGPVDRVAKCAYAIDKTARAYQKKIDPKTGVLMTECASYEAAVKDVAAPGGACPAAGPAAFGIAEYEAALSLAGCSGAARMSAEAAFLALFPNEGKAAAACWRSVKDAATNYATDPLTGNPVGDCEKYWKGYQCMQHSYAYDIGEGCYGPNCEPPTPYCPGYDSCLEAGTGEWRLTGGESVDGQPSMALAEAETDLDIESGLIFGAIGCGPLSGWPSWARHHPVHVAETTRDMIFGSPG